MNGLNKALARPSYHITMYPCHVYVHVNGVVGGGNTTSSLISAVFGRI